MRDAVTFPIWLLICLVPFFAIGRAARADILEVEPDAFPDGTIFNDRFPGVSPNNEAT